MSLCAHGLCSFLAQKTPFEFAILLSSLQLTEQGREKVTAAIMNLLLLPRALFFLCSSSIQALTSLLHFEIIAFYLNLASGRIEIQV